MCVFGGVIEGPFLALGVPWAHIWEDFGYSWDNLGMLLGTPKLSWGALGALWGTPGALLGALGRFGGVLGALLGVLWLS